MTSITVDSIKFLIGTIIVGVGWITTHYFTSKRDKKSKRRELSLGYLINAYRILADEIPHRKMTNEIARRFELVLVDIQLFGTEEQIALAKHLAVAAEKGKYDPDALIDSLRNDLRNQLGLSKVEGKLKTLRFPTENSQSINCI